MLTYRAYQVTGHRQFELVDRQAVPPSAGHVRFRAHSCGVCNSDVLGVEGMRDDPVADRAGPRGRRGDRRGRRRRHRVAGR